MVNIFMFLSFVVVGTYLCRSSKPLMKAIFIVWSAVYCGAALAGLFYSKLFSAMRMELIDAIGFLILIFMVVALEYDLKKKKTPPAPIFKDWRKALFFFVAVVFIAAMFYANRYAILPPQNSVIIH